MNQEDIKNLVGWLQAIYKQTEMTRGTTNEIRQHVNLLPEIRESTKSGSQDSNDAERKIEETRNHLENRIKHVEDSVNDIRSIVKDIQSKVDRIK